MKLEVLGSGGYYTNEHTHTACYMLPELGIIFDAGNGIFRAPKFVQTKEIHIFLSHAHPDHIEGIRMCCFLLNDTCKKITIYGLPEVIEALKIINRQPFSGCGELPYELKEINSLDTIKLDNGTEISTFPLFHSSPVLGFKLTHNKKSLAYVTDTRSTETEKYTQHIMNVDVLLQEVYFEEADKELAVTGGHSVPSMAAKVCNDANISRIYIIHHAPNGNRENILKELKNLIPTAELAYDNMEIEI